jgi:hypothetical protein
MFLKQALPVVLVAGALLLSAYGGPIGSWFAISSPLLNSDQLDASIAYNSQSQDYLVVWWDASIYWVWGQRVSRNGSLVGGPITTYEGSAAYQRFPDVAYNSQHDEYLVVWYDQDATYHSIRARRVAANGWISSAAFTVASGTIADTYLTFPAVAYASVADRYLVIYEYGNRYGWEQYGIAARAFRSDGSPDGAAFDVRPYGGGSPTVGLDLAYNRARNEFLVVWAEAIGTTYAILGRRVKMDGGAGTVGDIFTIADTPTLDDIYPAVAALPVPAGVGQYLVAWRYVYSLSDSDIYAQRVAGDGSGPVGLPIIISNPVADQGAPAVDGNETRGQYLVAWRHASAPPSMFVGIRGRAVSSGGDLLGQEEGVGGVFADHAAVAAGSGGDFLVAYQDMLLDASYRGIYGRLWGIRTYLPLVVHQ